MRTNVTTSSPVEEKGRGVTPDPINTSTTELSQWPQRPASEVFPELLDTTHVAMLFLFDRRGQTPDQGRRSVRKLAKEKGLPTLGRIGSTLMFRKVDVIEWLAARRSVDTAGADATVDAA